MNKDQKAALVDEIAERLGDANAIFAVDYRGISVPQAAELRAKLREADATFRVVKNRLAKRALERAGTAELDPLLEGPTALTLVKGDPVMAAKARRPVPVPMSAMLAKLLPASSRLSSASRHPVVVACWPVPKARPASISKGTVPGGTVPRCVGVRTWKRPARIG